MQPPLGTPPEITRSSRGQALLAFLLAPAVAGYCWQGVVHQVWGWSLVGLLLAAGFALLAWRAIITGHLRTNHGEFSRVSRPRAFWISVTVTFGLYGLAIGSLFFG